MNKVREQYENWIYPFPWNDLHEAARSGHIDASDPSLFRRKLWPRRVEPSQLKILIAGCGSTQAAWCAWRNPDCEVVGIDISQHSLAHQAMLKEKHGLHNLRLRELSLLEVDQLGESFDLIVSTGVLHHLPDPDAGLRSLKRVLLPHGVMSIMVYGWHRRFGVYMMQEAFRLLGIEQTREGLAQVRETLQALPAWHHVKSYANTAPDLNFDGGIVDTFLHPCDRAYSVKQVMQFIADNGLKFQDWLDRHSYSLPGLVPNDLLIAPLAAKLPSEQQWQLVELLGQSLGSHRFLICHPDREASDYAIGFSDSDTWLTLIPHLRVPVEVTQASDPTLGTSATLRRLTLTFTLDAREAPLFEAVNGERSIGQIIEICSNAGNRAEIQQLAHRLFARMHDFDHLLFEIP